MPGTRFSVLIRKKGQFSINEISGESCDVSEHSSTYTCTDGIIEHQFQPELIQKEDNTKTLQALLVSLNHGEPMPNETTEMYLKRGHQLVKQYKKIIGAPDLPIEELDPFLFLEYIWLQETQIDKRFMGSNSNECSSDFTLFYWYMYYGPHFLFYSAMTRCI